MFLWRSKKQVEAVLDTNCCAADGSQFGLHGARITGAGAQHGSTTMIVFSHTCLFRWWRIDHRRRWAPRAWKSSRQRTGTTTHMYRCQHKQWRVQCRSRLLCALESGHTSLRTSWTSRILRNYFLDGGLFSMQPERKPVDFFVRIS
jgi:hypothetical protein